MGAKGGCLEETEALVGLLPPGGILNWNAQNNQSHNQRTDVGRGPAAWGGKRVGGDNISFMGGDPSCASDTSALSPRPFHRDANAALPT